MEVDACEYRKAARIVAIINAVLLGLAIFGYVILFLMGIGLAVTASVDPKLTQDSKDAAVISGMVILIWILLAIWLITGIINLWAVANLLKATRMGTNIVEALPRARTWRNVVLVFLTIGVVYEIAKQAWASLAIDILIHGIMIYFVQKFISEMQQTLDSGKSHLPTHIAPVKQ